MRTHISCKCETGRLDSEGHVEGAQSGPFEHLVVLSLCMFQPRMTRNTSWSGGEQSRAGGYRASCLGDSDVFPASLHVHYVPAIYVSPASPACAHERSASSPAASSPSAGSVSSAVCSLSLGCGVFAVPSMWWMTCPWGAQSHTINRGDSASISQIPPGACHDAAAPPAASLGPGAANPPECVSFETSKLASD